MSNPKQNCWEVLGCGREPGGINTDSLGVCPVPTTYNCDGVNGGTNAGRFCWAIAGTLCGGVVQGIYAQKATNCMRCPFYLQVVQETYESRETLILSPKQLK
ncbi:MAG: hypothetical protein BroJett018_32570 [Chloroflexota bacterium]|nr:hypothetical protein [Chloroflexota bacterium]GIK65463.1 MAG: hypothetical protein BroJett018_32570 [Chloroflexota bacterium]